MKVQPELCRLEEDVVLRQVDSREFTTAVVEGLEDDLGVVASLEVDDDKLDVLAERTRQMRELGRGIVVPDPIGDLPLEERGRRGHKLRFVCPDRSRHHGLKRLAVRVRRPELERVMQPLDERLVVLNQLGQQSDCRLDLIGAGES